jgi:cystathionine gamma-synthase
MADTAMTIAKQLSNHPAVEEVLYPGLESSPSHALAKQQMKGFGALMSILIKGDDTTAIAVTNKLKLITRATSFGGTHSLIEHRASIEAEGSLTPKNLLRFSVGLEHVDDLIEDLLQALG